MPDIQKLFSKSGVEIEKVESFQSKNSESTMSKSESKRASVIGSDEYKALLSVKNDFPTYHIVIIAKEAKRSDDIKGLTYDYKAKI